MDLFDRLARQQSCWNLLEHPFYERWSAGALRRDDLAAYAGEYRHAAVALADATAAAAAQDPALAGHAEEEAAHIELWDRFAREVGADITRVPTPETAACVRAWTGYRRTLAGHLVALYAIESAQPPIAVTKAAGLRLHYGLDTPNATGYFDVHAERDLAHAAEGRALLERHAADADTDALVTEAGRVLRANWTLLDGVERLLSRTPA